MTAFDAHAVDVQLDASDRPALALIAGVDPLRPDMRGTFVALRGLLWVVLVMAALLHPIVWTAVAIETGVILVERRVHRRMRQPRVLDVLNGRYEVTPFGLRKTAAVGETLIVWHAVDSVSQNGSHLFVRFSGTGWIVPFRCFTSDDHREAFVVAIQEHLGGRLVTGE